MTVISLWVGRPSGSILLFMVVPYVRFFVGKREVDIRHPKFIVCISSLAPRKLFNWFKVSPKKRQKYRIPGRVFLLYKHSAEVDGNWSDPQNEIEVSSV